MQIFLERNKPREKSSVVEVITSKERAACEEMITEVLLGGTVQGCQKSCSCIS